ncbi:hypothetical protein BOX15_Mlig001022g1 [Macrostomum lignano]|uniref:Uncharacterized protein n=1 Tax=Macrostomum lignano TaxID=282301 RepID=A0A267F5S1_9PLAT|nr:hypothetical protein BOX15_Mlig001022g1 [Macrostomum lignano]
MDFYKPEFSSAELAASLTRHLLLGDSPASSSDCYAVAMVSAALPVAEFEAAEYPAAAEWSSVLQERDLLAEAAPDDEDDDRADEAETEATPRRLQRRPPRPPSSSSVSRPVGLYGSARVPDVRLSGDPVTAYRESLRISLRAFRRRQWRPLDVEALEAARDPEDINRRSCRLGRGGGDGGYSRPVSAAGSAARFPAPSRRRPKSVPAEALKSRAASKAAAEEAAAAAAKDPEDPPPPRPLRLEDCAPAFTPRFYDWQSGGNDDGDNATATTANGVSSSDGDDSDAADDNDVDNEEKSSPKRTTAAAAAATAAAADSGADAHRQRRRRFRAPDLNLPPEREPQFLLASSCLEPDKFEFSAKLVLDLPRFEFGTALPDPFSNASFRSLAECENGWRSVFPEALAESEPGLAGLMDRLIAMERLQLHTVRMEAARFGAAGSAALATRRATSASVAGSSPATGGGRLRSQNCCRGCLQVGCSGDCPLKRAPNKICLHCRQPMCLDGACLRRTYNDRAREAPDSQLHQPQQQQPQRKNSQVLLPSKFCKPCEVTSRPPVVSRQRQQGGNVGVGLLSRPRSQLPTYSSSAQSKRPKSVEIRQQRQQRQRQPAGRQPTSVNFSEQLRDASVIDVTREQNRFKAYTGVGRNTLIPGKTRVSMRRHSLTANRRVWSAV